jgi:Tol biopolymer transport system component
MRLTARPFAAAVAVAAVVATSLAAGLTLAAAAGAAVPVGYPAPPMTLGPVDASSGDQVDPHISGSLVAYTDFSSGNGVIRYADLATGASGAVPALGDGSDSLPAVSGNTISYVHFSAGGHAIATWTVGDATATVLDPMPGSNRRAAAVGADTVAWQDFGTNTLVSPEIVAYDRSTGTTTQLTNDTRYDRDPAVDPSGDVITWAKCTSLAGGCDIWDAVRTDSGWTTHRLTGDATEEWNPHTNGTVVVYAAQPGDESTADIRWQSVAGGPEQNADLGGYDDNPHISGNLISFNHYQSSADPAEFDIDVYDLATNALYQLTNTANDEYLSDVWTGTDGTTYVVFNRLADTGDDNVYAATFTAPEVSRTTLTTTSRPDLATTASARLTATVGSSGTPTGSVQFRVNGTALAGPVTLLDGRATLTTTLPAGTDQVTADYSGGGEAGPSTSSPLTFTVHRIRSSTALAALDPDSAGQGLTASVTGGGQPSGSVQFLVNNHPWGTPIGVDQAGQARSTQPLSAGALTVVARYLGDDIRLPSTSGALHFVVPPLTTHVQYGPIARDFSTRVTVTVRLRAVGGRTVPTGSIEPDSDFTCGDLVARTATVSTARCSARVPQNTTETVTLHYPGDDVYTPTDGHADVTTGGW